MLCKDIMQVVEATYPRHKALEWDNVGLLVGRQDKDVQKVYVALDITDSVIERAIEQDVDLIVTHHPMVFSPIKQVTDADLVGRRILKLIQHDICYYAMHTNYDVVSMADLSSAILGLKDTSVLEATNAERTEGIGRVGTLNKPMTVLECCELVKEKFALDAVKVYGDLNQVVHCVAISPGSGKHMSELAISKGADVFVTAEIDHHEGIDSNAEGLAIIDAGHYGLEHIFIEDMVGFLQKNIGNIEVLGAQVEHPFHVV